MDPAEQQEMLTRISQLKGQIQQKKSQQFQPNSYAQRNTYGGHQQSGSSWGASRGGYSTRGYARGGRVPHHRNKTLVLNGSTTTSGATPPGNNENADPSVNDQGATWIVKNDGKSRQLINPNVYEQGFQKRAQDLELSRQQKLKRRDEREKAQVLSSLQRPGGTDYSGSATPAINNEVTVNGIRFRVTKGGSKLAKVPGEFSAAKSTPKSAVVSGIRFFRSRSGNMYRANIVKAHRRAAVIKKINEPCQKFSTTGTCLKGPRCRYIHDPRKVAVCKDFLQKGFCPSGDSCDLSHELTPERTPACLHFAKGNCSKPSCAYTHVRVSPTAPVCRAFAIYGYCENGASCMERHVNECPDFSNTGTCNTQGCKLLHRYKASVMRNNNRSAEQSPEESSDISSDAEGQEIGSDDVDSDDLDEEFFGDDDGTIDLDSLRQDYVHLA